MMPSSSQVLDPELIFQIIYGVGQFHHRQKRGEERRVFPKKAAAGCQKNRAAATKHRGVGEVEVEVVEVVVDERRQVVQVEVEVV